MTRKNKVNVLFKQARNIPLNEKFLQSFRSNLVDYIKMNPLPLGKKPITVWQIFSLRLIPITGVAVFFILLAGGASVNASQKSIPGDFLYSVKLASERLKAALIPEGKSKANFRIEQAYTRIGEIKKLQEKTRGSKDQIENANASLLQETSRQFSSHIKDALHESEVFKKEGMVKEAGDIHGKVALSLGVYKEMIKTRRDESISVHTGKKDEDNGVKDLQEKIKRESGETRGEEIKNAIDKSIIQEKINSALKDSEEVEKLIEDNKGRILRDITSKAEDTVKKAKDKIQKAQEKLNRGDLDNALDKIDDVFSLLRQSKALIGTALSVEEEKIKEVLPQIDTVLEEEIADQEEGAKEGGENENSKGSNNKDNHSGRKD